MNITIQIKQARSEAKRLRKNWQAFEYQERVERERTGKVADATIQESMTARTAYRGALRHLEELQAAK